MQAKTFYQSLIRTVAVTCLLLLAGVNFSAKAQSLCNAQFTFQAAPGVNGVQFTPVAASNTAIYQWTFGDGDSSRLFDPMHAYLHSGSYQACLTVTEISPNGVLCTATWCDSVHIGVVQPNCNAHFTITGAGTVFQFTPSFNANSTTYSWDFGDGNTSAAQGTSHVYTQSGAYNVCLTVVQSNSAGQVICTATWCDSVHVVINQPVCDAHFTHQYNPSSNLVYFAGINNPGAAVYSWNFGDNQTGNGLYASHSYSNSGTYYVCLEVNLFDNAGALVCTSRFCDSVHIGNVSICNAHFTFTIAANTNTCVFAPGSLAFGNNYMWNFGDGGTSTLASPSHTYAIPGNYTVCLAVSQPAVFGNVGCTATWCDTVHIGPVIHNCNPHFTFQGNNAGNAIYFAAPNNGTGATYNWNFGDGTFGSGMTLAHAFPHAGAFYVCLEVALYDATGLQICVATWCDSVHVGNAVPVCDAHFTWQTTPGVVGFSFSASANAPHTSYSWNFGDGTTGSGPNPIHAYSHTGNYLVCLAVVTTDSASGNILCTANWCDSLRYANATTCNAHFTSQQSNAANGIHFYPAPNPTGTMYHWDFGDGSFSNLLDPVHQYTSPGAYWVCLTVAYQSPNGGSCTSQWCDSVHYATTFHCDAHFTVQPGSVINGLHFSPAPNPVGTTYAWDFGDGSTSALLDPNHVYAQVGAYLVCLTVTYAIPAGGVCTSSWCDSIHVIAAHANCDAHFVAVRDTSPGTFHFAAAPNAANATYLWNFGDSTSSTGPNPTHVYSGPGRRQVCLTVTSVDPNGIICTDTWCMQIYVAPHNFYFCRALFTFQQIANANYTVAFHNISRGAFSVCSWDFGDGNTSNLINPVHQYGAPGTYHVCLTITDLAHGCSNTICRAITLSHPFSDGTTSREGAFGDVADDGLSVTIFPNPLTAESVIRVENSTSSVTFRLFDNTGRQVDVRENLGDGDYGINSASLAPGLYFYQVIEVNQVISTGKLVVQ